MTATETLVSSRLMKTDDSPQDTVKRTKKPETEQTEKFRTKFKKASLKKEEHSEAVYPTALSLFVFLIVFPLSYLAWLAPHFSHHTTHIHPHSFSTLTRSLTAVAAPWKCMEMDPSFVCSETGLLLESEPCLKSEAEGGRGKMRF